MTTGLPISTFVRVTTALAAGGVLRTQFGTGLLVTTDTAIAAGGSGKVRLFADIAAVNAVLDDGPTLRDAAVWFSADPAPKSLYIGRWATVDVPTTLRGTAPGEVSELAVGNAGFRIGENTYTLNLSTATTYAAIATAIDEAISDSVVSAVTIDDGGSGYDAAATITFTGGGASRQATGTLTITGGVITGVTITDPGAGYTSAPTITVANAGSGSGANLTAVIAVVDSRLNGASFVYDSDAFLLTLASGIAFETGFTAPASGVDISALLGFTAPEYRQGHDTESLVDAVGEMVGLAQGGAPVALMLASDAPNTHDGTDSREALAAYAEAGDFIYGLLDTSDAAITTGDTTSHAARVFDRQQSHVEAIYSMPGQRPDIALLALMSSQNLNLPATIITPHLKPLPGVLPTDITETQRVELERKRTNVYTRIGGLPSLVGGFTGRAGAWLDAQWWLLWLKNEVELNVFNAQRASRRFNTAILNDTLGTVMEAAVRNGGARPGGRVSNGLRDDIRQVTGNQDFDGVLPAGYLVWIESPNARSDLDRENRIGRFKAWVSPSDAIHRVIGDIVLSS